MSVAEDQIQQMLSKDIDPREFDKPDFQHDPFPLYKRLRDDHPLYHDRFHNRWVISRYWDVDSVFQATEAYTRGIYSEEGPYEFGSRHVFGPNILEYGRGEHHQWLRNVIAGEFVGRKLNDFLPVIDMIARELIDKFRNDGEVELVSQFSNQFPIRVISNMLGLPREDEDTFVGWYQALIAGLGFGGAHLARGITARNEMWDYLDPLIAQRRAQPGEDLLSRIIHAERDDKKMSDEEIKGFVALLLAAGGDTTDKAIANMWYHMMYTRPDQYQQVRDNPDLWENVFTEMMRYDPVVHMQGRRALEEIAMYDDVIPRGAFVVIYLGAGNRDERVFKNPDTFDALRDDLHMGRENRSGRYKDGKPGHLGFGMGQHFCMGYAMARQEAVLASTYFAKELKGLRPKFKEHDGIYSPNIDSGGFRSPAELWLEFDVD